MNKNTVKNERHSATDGTSLKEVALVNEQFAKPLNWEASRDTIRLNLASRKTTC
jgi:hypothetical protein